MFRRKKFFTHFPWAWLGVSVLINFCTSERMNDFGRRIGNFREYGYGVAGTVYAIDESTLYIHGFRYNPPSQNAYFWMGNTQRPSPEGFIVPYPETYKGSEPPELKSHNGSRIILKLPDGKKLKDVTWLSVWCPRFTLNFGEIFIPGDLEPPKMRVLPEFKRLAHGLRSGNITILDARTFYIPNLHYDGKGPDAYFWVGNGTEPSEHGVKVPNEMGSLDPLRAYEGEDIEIQLPGSLQVYDIDWLAVWCVKFSHNFGHVMVPKDLDVPPSLGQTKISTSSTPTDSDKRKELSNCRELLAERLQVQWEVHEERVLIQLSAAIRMDQYIAFGISGEHKRPSMVGSDVVVAYYDENGGKFHASDYYISATSQCDGKSGVCPDEVIRGRNDVKLIHGERRHGITTVIYERPLQTNEPVNDKPISVGTKTNVIAAIGPLNSANEPNSHDLADKSLENMYIDFGSTGDYTCSRMELEDDTPKKPWPKSAIRNTNIFRLQIGPSVGRRSNLPANKRPSIGLAWYVNGKLSPEIYVERGKTYTFVVEGGNIISNYLQYHPLYITDNEEGAFGRKSESEQKDQRIFGGISYDSEGNPLPNTAGRFCEYAYKTTDQTTLYETFEQFSQTLERRCDPGEPAFLNWTVDIETPNMVYYQCYIHSYMGSKIHVEDPTKPHTKKNSGSAIFSSTTGNFVLLTSTFLHYFVL